MASEIGLIGLGVMGKSLARNFASRGISVSVYNVPFPGEEKVTEEFIAEFPESKFYGAKNLEDFVQSLQKERLVLLMIKSGDPVDEMIEKLIPLLEKGDSIIDAGNSFYKDTRRRSEYLSSKGLHFVGMGVSGGEEGALNGPSIMPAGSDLSKERLLPLLNKIAAVSYGEPCVSWIGADGAGHFVKMVHNGIEYADMQLLSEAYGLCRYGAKMSNSEIADFFETKFVDLHESYLLSITIDILREEEDEIAIIDTILDVAGHKGTGMWTSREALEMGVAVPSITAAMNQRIISSYKPLRTSIAAGTFQMGNVLQKEVLESVLPLALLTARLVAHAEGFHLMQVASDTYNWNLDMQKIAKIWRGGCIIRSAMLPVIAKAYYDYESENTEGTLEHLFLDETFQTLLNNNFVALSGLLSSALIGSSIATPCLSASHEYLRSMCSEILPINMIQAQRDYFGAHTYRTIEDPDTPKHTIWKK